jgi:hypothetical protein
MAPVCNNIVAYLLKARIVEPAETAVDRQWLSERHVTAATFTFAIELLEAVFSVRSVPKLYYEDQMPWRRQFVNSARKVTAEGIQQLDVGVRWSSACEDVSSEGEEHPPLGSAAKQR